jgi:hypothetical protein
MFSPIELFFFVSFFALIWFVRFVTKVGFWKIWKFWFFYFFVFVGMIRIVVEAEVKEVVTKFRHGVE